MAEKDDKPQAKIIDSKSLYNGFFKLDELTIEMDLHKGGKETVKRLNFERGNAVAILAYDPKRDEVVLINEVRPAMLARGEYPFSDALSAGMIDEGETAVQAAEREMEEETGQKLHNPKTVHSGAFVSAGGTSEKISLVYGEVDATKAGGIHGEVSEGENIKTVVVSADEFIARAEDGRLRDMKSMACAFWLAAHRDELKDPAAPKAEAPAPAPVSAKKPQAAITGRKSLCESIFNIEELTIEMDLHQGGKQTLKRLNFERGDSVAVLGYDPVRDEVVLINEMRVGMLAAGEYPYAETLPAAVLKTGEDVTAAAVKTMDRKAGAKLENPVLIHDGAFVSAGGTSEKIALVLGTVDTSPENGIQGRISPTENIKALVIPANEFIARAEDGRLRDMKSVTLAFWLACHREELKQAAQPKPKNSAPGPGV